MQQRQLDNGQEQVGDEPVDECFLVLHAPIITRFPQIARVQSEKLLAVTHCCARVYGELGAAPEGAKSSPFFDFFGPVGHILDPVLIQPVGVVISAHGAVTLAEEHDKLALTTSSDPTVIVFLDGGSAPARLRAIGRLDPLVQDAVLSTRSTVLSVADGSDNRGKLIAQLSANIHLDSVLKLSSACSAVLGYDGIVSLGGLGESRGAEQEECDDCLHTYIIGYFEAELKSFFEFFSDADIGQSAMQSGTLDDL